MTEFGSNVVSSSPAKLILHTRNAQIEDSSGLEDLGQIVDKNK